MKSLAALQLPAGQNAIASERCGLVDEFIVFGPFAQDVYKTFIEQMLKLGYQQSGRPDFRLIAFPYDWRQSNFDNAKRLSIFVEDFAVRNRLKADAQFDIVAHSMGGIVATLYAKSKPERIARLITVGTPYQGSAEVLASLQNGWGWWQRQLISMETVRATMLSFPSVLELLPTYNNCCGFGTPGRATAVDLLSAPDLAKITWFQDIDQSTLPARLESVRLLRSMMGPPSVPTVRILGIRQNTVEQIYFQSNSTSPISHISRSWQGDGTVMAYSALGGMSVGPLPGSIAHDRLMSDRRVIEQLEHILLFKSSPPKEIAGAIASCASPDGSLVGIDGASISGTDRIFKPNEDMDVHLEIRTSATDVPRDALQKLRLTAARENSTENIAFSPVGDAQTRQENALGGSIDDYRIVRYAAKITSPQQVGRHILRVTCASILTSEHLLDWSFGVSQ